MIKSFANWLYKRTHKAELLGLSREIRQLDVDLSDNDTYPNGSIQQGVALAKMKAWLDMIEKLNLYW